jgi:DNA-binding MarR family transcriptional regulator
MLAGRAEDHIDTIVNSLRRITQALRLSSSVVQDKLGISGAQLFVLQQLADHPASSLRELQDRTFTDQSSVSVVVSRLVGSGHVARKRSKVDARRLELNLTGTGRATVRKAPPLAQTQLMTTLRAVPAAELGVTAVVLERVARDVDMSSGKPQMFFEPPPAKSGRRRRRA